MKHRGKRFAHRSDAVQRLIVSVCRLFCISGSSRTYSGHDGLLIVTGGRLFFHLHPAALRADTVFGRRQHSFFYKRFDDGVGNGQICKIIGKSPFAQKIIRNGFFDKRGYLVRRDKRVFFKEARFFSPSLILYSPEESSSLLTSIFV